MDELEMIPVLEVPGLEKIGALEERIVKLEEALAKLGKELTDGKQTAGTMLSGLLPGGVMHDRVAEARAAVKALTDDPANPMTAGATALLKLNWGAMSVEE